MSGRGSNIIFNFEVAVCLKLYIDIILNINAYILWVEFIFSVVNLRESVKIIVYVSFLMRALKIAMHSAVNTEQEFESL